MSHKIRTFIDNRSDLELFLIRAGLLYFLWLILKMLFNNVSFLIPLAQGINNILAQILIFLSKKTLIVLGYEPTLDGHHLYIEGSRGVNVARGYLGWFLLSVYAGFIIVYPGNKKSKFIYIVIGLVILIILNSFRITNLVLVSNSAQEKVPLYHRYICKTILHLSVLIMWLIWVKKHGKKMQGAK